MQNYNDSSGTIEVRNRFGELLIRENLDHRLVVAGLSADGRRMVGWREVSDDRYVVEVWDIGSRALIAKTDLSFIPFIQMSPDGAYVLLNNLGEELSV